MNLDYFQTKNLYTATHQLFSETLQIPIQKTGVEVPYSTKEIFENYYKSQNSAFQKIENLFLIGMVLVEVFENENNKNKIVDFEEVKKDTKQDKYKDGILIFAIEFKNKQTPTRSELASLTRNLNQLYNQFPTILVAKYEVENKIQDKNNTNEFHQKIAISSTERLSYKQEWRIGEKIGKIAMLKDISIPKPHRGHEDILLQMQINRKDEATNKLENQVSTFEELTNHWLKAFDTKLLSKKFYTEIANWYFWAVENVKFAAYDDKNVQQVNEIACIRFITRLVFVWFLREKGLISESFFDEKNLKDNLLNDFDIRRENDSKPATKTNQNQLSLGENTEKQDTKEIKTTHSYYNAILQNLFFATLNKPRGSREFATDEGRKNIGTFDMNMFYRYEKLFKNQDTEFIINLFDTIPFVNGGLFDSLDDKINDRFIDGFTRIKTKQAQIPDYLFFAEKSTCFQNQLNKIYETKSKKYEVQGIINILKNYKFTVEENTPLEQDVALDPDLLGQIFENLLAYYNPETGQTARKSSGSFYTPPEIVNYMVEESLLEFFINNFEKQSEKNAGYVPFGEQQISAFGGSTNKKGNYKIEIPLKENIITIDAAYTKENFRELLKIENEESPFSEIQNKEILTCIYKNLKILDPACGSGAFPMAILDKLVQLVRKLDNQNIFFENLVKEPIQKQIDEKTKEQKQLIEETTQLVNQIKIEQIKQNALKELEELKQKLTTIENDFNQNLKTNDYARKLHLIQNCIYGIDIQPIAVQITKLRFFLSLIIEQKPDFTQNKETDNFGIETLPNLEIKFVAANTLIGLDKPKQLGIVSPRVLEIENEIEKLRKSYFSLQNKTQKNKVQNQEEELRKELAQLLENAGWNNSSANQIADFNIFDQTRESAWYDSKWMFGIEKGFDIVIGNPPYVQLQKMKKEQKGFEKQNYQTYSKSGDLYCLFYEKGNLLLKNNGILSFITSNKWLKASYGNLLRNYLLTQTEPTQLVDFGGYKVFETATVDTNILVFKRNDKVKSINLEATKIQNDYKKSQNLYEYTNKNKIQLTDLTDDVWSVADKEYYQIKQKVEKIAIPLKDWDINIYRGITTGFNEAFIIDKETKERLIREDPKSEEIINPLLRGKDINKYDTKFADLYLINSHNGIKSKNINRINVVKDYPAVYKFLLKYENQLAIRQDKGEHWTNLRNCAYIEEFEKEKIIWQEISQSSCFTKSDPSVYLPNSAYMLTDYNAYILGVLNSKFIEWYFRNFISVGLGKTGLRYTNQYVQNIPIPKISDSEQQPFISLVERILVLKKEGKSSSFEEKELDNLVFDLYGLSEQEKGLVRGDD